MSQTENNKPDIEKAREKIKDAMSLLIILENDLETQKSDGIHLRAVKVIHELLRNAEHELST